MWGIWSPSSGVIMNDFFLCVCFLVSLKFISADKFWQHVFWFYLYFNICFNFEHLILDGTSFLLSGNQNKIYAAFCIAAIVTGCMNFCWLPCGNFVFKIIGNCLCFCGTYYNRLTVEYLAGLAEAAWSKLTQDTISCCT